MSYEIFIGFMPTGRAIDHLENDATMIVQYSHAQVRNGIVVPESVAIVKEGHISCNQDIGHFSCQAMANSRAAAAINAARAAVREHPDSFLFSGKGYQVSIPNRHTIG